MASELDNEYIVADSEWTTFDLGDNIMLYEAQCPGGFIWHIENKTIYMCLFEADFKQSVNVTLHNGEDEETLLTRTIWVHPLNRIKIIVAKKSDEAEPWSLKVSWGFELYTCQNAPTLQAVVDSRKSNLDFLINSANLLLRNSPISISPLNEALRLAATGGGTSFVDVLFPPKLSSIFIEPEVFNSKSLQWLSWRRPVDFFGPTRTVKVFLDGISPFDVQPGMLNNSWLLGGLMACAELPSFLHRLFISRRTTNLGLYRIRLPLRGGWKLITIDDLLPCFLQGGPVFARTEGCELWVSLLEKAFAKHYGCYTALVGGNVADALEDLTGCPVQTIPLRDVVEPSKKENLRSHTPSDMWEVTSPLEYSWRKLMAALEKGCLVTLNTEETEMTSSANRYLSTGAILETRERHERLMMKLEAFGQGKIPAGGDELMKSTQLLKGLRQDAAEALLDIATGKRINSQRSLTVLAAKHLIGGNIPGGEWLVKLRNPWPEVSWSGAWSEDRKEEWTDVVRKVLGRNSWEDEENGLLDDEGMGKIIWMKWLDATRLFTSMSICWSLDWSRIDPQTGMRCEVRRRFLFAREGESVNPTCCYLISIPKQKTRVFINLHQEDERDATVFEYRPYIDLGVAVSPLGNSKRLRIALKKRAAQGFTAIDFSKLGMEDPTNAVSRSLLRRDLRLSGASISMENMLNKINDEEANADGLFHENVIPIATDFKLGVERRSMCLEVDLPPGDHLIIPMSSGVALRKNPNAINSVNDRDNDNDDGEFEMETFIDPMTGLESERKKQKKKETAQFSTGISDIINSSTSRLHAKYEQALKFVFDALDFDGIQGWTKESLCRAYHMATASMPNEQDWQELITNFASVKMKVPSGEIEPVLTLEGFLAWMADNARVSPANFMRFLFSWGIDSSGYSILYKPVGITFHSDRPIQVRQAPLSRCALSAYYWSQITCQHGAKEPVGGNSEVIIRRLYFPGSRLVSYAVENHHDFLPLHVALDTSSSTGMVSSKRNKSDMLGEASVGPRGCHRLLMHTQASRGTKNYSSSYLAAFMTDRTFDLSNKAAKNGSSVGGFMEDATTKVVQNGSSNEGSEIGEAGHNDFN